MWASQEQNHSRQNTFLSHLQISMCHKSISILDLLRRPTWILASLTLFAPAVLAWNCTTCEQWGTCSDKSWTITQDVWGAATNWQQCLYCASHSHWQIVANLKAQTWVGSYSRPAGPPSLPIPLRAEACRAASTGKQSGWRRCFFSDWSKTGVERNPEPKASAGVGKPILEAQKGLRAVSEGIKC